MDSPDESASAGGSSRAPDPGRGEAPSEFAGEGGAGDESEVGTAKDADTDDSVEVTATPSAPPADAKKKDPAAPAAPAASAAGKASPCDDSNGSAPDCAELESGACGDVFGPLCEQLGDALKPRIATAIVECLVENNRRSRCESIEECLKRGLEQACVSPPDREVCEKLFARCDPPQDGPWQDVDDCARGVASLKQAVRAKVVECLEDSCDLETCFLKAGS